ncbi:MAG: protein kinase [Deltaproteobacteria bacterium]|nr:protein kinase [Deltaproteobacteria bacterium]
MKPRSSVFRASTSENQVPNAHRTLTAGSVVLGRYTIQKVIGRGGMATVYLARNQQTERLVALKILDPEISNDPSYVERFRREARAAGRIRSDHVVSIYDLDAEVGGTLVLVMEYLEGQTIQQALRNGRLPIPRSLVLSRHLFEGLAAAHDAGVIHRDLKPANLFIERLTGGNEKLKILDFGISKLAEASTQELTRAGQTLGTLAYMAPEQIRGTVKGNDPRIDLYSAGVSMFLMLTAKRPIDADDTVALLQAVLERPPLSLAEATGVPFPPALETFIATALQKDPGQRFQTALEMRDALIATAAACGMDAVAALQPPPMTGGPAVPAPAVAYAPPGPPRTSGPGPGSNGDGPAPAYMTPSGVVSVPANGPQSQRLFPAFEDIDEDDDEGKTVVRAPTMPPTGPGAAPMSFSPEGNRPSGASPLRVPTSAQGLPVLPPIPVGQGAAQQVVRTPTIMGMPPVQNAGPGLGGPGVATPPPSYGPSSSVEVDAATMLNAVPISVPPPPSVLGGVASTMISPVPNFAGGPSEISAVFGSPPTGPQGFTPSPGFGPPQGFAGPHEPTPAPRAGRRAPANLLVALAGVLALGMVSAAVFVVYRTPGPGLRPVANAATAPAPSAAPTEQPTAPVAQPLVPAVAQALVPPPSAPTPGAEAAPSPGAPSPTPASPPAPVPAVTPEATPQAPPEAPAVAGATEPPSTTRRGGRTRTGRDTSTGDNNPPRQTITRVQTGREPQGNPNPSGGTGGRGGRGGRGHGQTGIIVRPPF